MASRLIRDVFVGGVGHEARRYESKRKKNVASGFIPDVGVDPRRQTIPDVSFFVGRNARRYESKGTEIRSVGVYPLRFVFNS